MSDVTGSWGSNGGEWAIMVHGGAGDVAAHTLASRIEGCKRAAAEGAKLLAKGATALDAAQRAVEVLEDDPLFNAGTGACLTSDGTVELDASIMEGRALRAGAVCALPPFKNPIAIARAVLEDGAHVLYAGPGAERFAREHGFARAGDEELVTPGARATWERMRAHEAGAGAGAKTWTGGGQEKCGTVGAVARDATGSVAAATSTGGRMFKRVGRVGDSPIPGAGNYADDDGGACSITGDGEGVMRLCLAKAACDAMRERLHPEDAARALMQHLFDRVEATGGMILVDRRGRLGLARTSNTMSWAAMAADWDQAQGGS